MKNQDIRMEVRGAGIKLWQVGEALGMSDSTFSRCLRHELSDSKKAEIRKVIRNMSDNRDAAQ